MAGEPIFPKYGSTSNSVSQVPQNPNYGRQTLDCSNVKACVGQRYPPLLNVLLSLVIGVNNFHVISRVKAAIQDVAVGVNHYKGPLHLGFLERVRHFGQGLA